MRQENQQKRRAQIEQAAYELFEQKGFAGTSMLSVAKRAKASNETLYRWYGDKLGLFMSLIERNLDDVNAVLKSETVQTDDPIETLQKLGPKLLELLTGTRAIALNRAAAADSSGALGLALAKGGRETVMPMVQSVFTALLTKIEATNISVSQASELYINLLVGELQARRMIGVIAPLNKSEIDARADRALRMILKILS